MASSSADGPTARSTDPSATTRTVGITAAVMTLFLPADFLWSYAMNDDVGWDDHWGFLRRAVVVVVAVGVGAALATRVTEHVPIRRALPGSLLLTSAVLLAAGGGYAVLSLLPALDPAIGSSVSDADCLLLAVVQLAAAAVAGLLGSRLVEPTHL